MSQNHPSIAFQFTFYADGSTGSVSVNLSSGPIIYNLPASSGTNVLATGFNITASSVKNLSIDSGLTITSDTVLLGCLTVNFTGTVAAGTIVTVSGILLY